MDPPKVSVDNKSHHYSLVLRPDNTFSLLIDLEEKVSGSLLENFEPAYVPPEVRRNSSPPSPSKFTSTHTHSHTLIHYLNPSLILISL